MPYQLKQEHREGILEGLKGQRAHFKQIAGKKEVTLQRMLENRHDPDELGGLALWDAIKAKQIEVDAYNRCSTIWSLAEPALAKLEDFSDDDIIFTIRQLITHWALNIATSANIDETDQLATKAIIDFYKRLLDENGEIEHNPSVEERNREVEDLA